MFQPSCRAIFRLITEKWSVQYDNDLNLRDFVLQEFVKIIVICLIQSLRLKFKCGTLYNKH